MTGGLSAITDNSAYALYGDNTTPGCPGIQGTSSSGYGIWGSSTDSVGVYGNSTNDNGGYFSTNNSSEYGLRVGSAGLSSTNPGLYVAGTILASGTKSFVQDHPNDPNKEIVYVCLEGGEAGTYCRGEGKLENGVVAIELPEHFSLVANEKGITVQITPKGEYNGLMVTEATNTKIIVKELNYGTSNVSFYYLVNGVRKGYENHQVIRDKVKRHKKMAEELKKLEEKAKK